MFPFLPSNKNNVFHLFYETRRQDWAYILNIYFKSSLLPESMHFALEKCVSVLNCLGTESLILLINLYYIAMSTK
jgi:hypothetical protein